MTGQPPPMDPTLMAVLYAVVMLVVGVVCFFPPSSPTASVRHAHAALSSQRLRCRSVQQRAPRTVPCTGYITVLAILVFGYLLLAILMGISAAFIPTAPAAGIGAWRAEQVFRIPRPIAFRRLFHSSDVIIRICSAGRIGHNGLCKTLSPKPLRMALW